MNKLILALVCLPTSAVIAQEAERRPAMFLPTPVPAPAAVQRHVPPPPVAVSVDQRAMLIWEPTILRCGDRPIAAMPIRRPWNMLVWPGFKAMPVSFAFAIDATGRTTAIRRRRDETQPLSGDLGPALAATRFAAGAPQADCTIVYAPQVTPIGEVPIADLISYTLTPESGPLPVAGWNRIAAGASCRDEPRPQPLVQVYPDFRKVPGTPGVKDWSMVRYDTDARGRPRNLRTVSGTGNAALDAASLKAIRASRYTEGARAGCLYPYWKMPATLAPPPIPTEVAYRPKNATCPTARDWTTRPVLRFPDNYQRRSIEGWAIVTYDLAPWGEPGNIHAVAAEPSADFGTAAEAVIRGARLPASDRGATGCVDRVIFKIGPGSAGAPPPPF